MMKCNLRLIIPGHLRRDNLMSREVALPKNSQRLSALTAPIEHR